MHDLEEVARKVIEDGWNHERFDGLTPYLADEILFNYRGMQHSTSLGQMKRAVAGWKDAFPDFMFEIVHLICDGPLVALNLLMTGTHLGPWKEIEATGKRARVNNVMIFRFEQDRLVEVWEVLDELDLRRQLSDAN